MEIKRYFSHPSETLEDVFNSVNWDSDYTAEIKKANGEIVFRQEHTEFPISWGENARNIVASKYFYGKDENREKSLKEFIRRIVYRISSEGINNGYLKPQSEEVDIFCAELGYLYLNQMAFFNTPVNFSIGVSGKRQVCSACYILGVEDNLHSILEHAKTEGLVFKDGSGCGVNLSSLRGSNEFITDSSGTSSGPMSFDKIYDTVAKITKSGGSQRRAARMVILNDNHPDIEEFITCKAKEEEKAKALIREGYDSSPGGEAYLSVAYQNANYSVRISDEFLKAVEEDRNWDLINVKDKKVAKTVKAKELWNLICKSCWESGDPGVQFDSTIQKWHTLPNTGRINGSNPCCCGDTLITLEKSGTLKIEDAIGLNEKILGINIDYTQKIKDNDINKTLQKYYSLDYLENSGIVCNGEKEIFLVEFYNGKSIKVTEDHQFLCYQNYGDFGGIYTSGIPLNRINFGPFADNSPFYGRHNIVTFTDGMIELTQIRNVISLGKEKVYDVLNIIPQINGLHGDHGFYLGNNIAIANCSEFLHLDFSSCNLASINLLTYLNKETFEFDYKSYLHTIRLLTIAMNILIDFCEFPTEKIAEETKKTRPIGIGFANLGALLMSLGIPYDSDKGRDYAAALMGAITGRAYFTSNELAKSLNREFEYLYSNRKAMGKVLNMHGDHYDLLLNKFRERYTDSNGIKELVEEVAGLDWANTRYVNDLTFLNSQVSVIAPTGCLTKNSIISTEHGLIRLSNLGNIDGEKWQNKSFKVMTDEGPKEATKFFVNGQENVRTIITEHGYKITGTNKHKIKIIDQNGNKIWKRFDEINETDTCILRTNTIFGKQKDIILPSEPEIYHNANYEFKVPRILNEELAELVGYYMGDGCYCGKEMRLAVAEDDLDVIERLKYLIKNLFNLEAVVKSQEGCVCVNIKNYSLMLWWESCGFMKIRKLNGKGKGAFEVHIPDMILASNNENIYGAFLKGLFEADGCATSDNPSLSSISSQFISDVQTVMLAMGIPTHTRVRSKVSKNRYGKNACYTLSVLNRNYSQKFLEKINFISQRKINSIVLEKSIKSCSNDKIPLNQEIFELVSSKCTVSNSKQYNKYKSMNRETCIDFENSELNKLLENTFYAKVVENVDSGIQDTYDLSVPENVTYIANGFVSHNTIGLAMGCDTTGCEPELALVKYKWLVGGGTQRFVNSCIEDALIHLRYSKENIELIKKFIEENGNIENCPFVNKQHVSVFDTSFVNKGGTRSLNAEAHIKMLGALAPFISGSASKTVNLPESATIKDISNAFLLAHKLGVKCVAIYRDNCKASQPLSTEIKEDKKIESINHGEYGIIPLGKNFWNPNNLTSSNSLSIPQFAQRSRLPDTRKSITHKFDIAGHEFYAHLGFYEDGKPGELFITAAKEGSFVRGIMDALATVISLGLQYGVPLNVITAKLRGAAFEPAGWTSNPEIQQTTSVVDYLAKFLDSASKTKSSQVEINFTPPPNFTVGTTVYKTDDLLQKEESKLESTNDPCPICGGILVWQGKCKFCMNCSETIGGCGS